MVINQFKPLIKPLQMWLLKNGRCVGCGKELKKTAKVKKRTSTEDIYTCECGRIYIFDKNKKQFRRALPKELS